MKINFYLIGKSKDQPKAVYAYVKPLKNDPRRYTVHTGQFIKPEFWDSNNQEAFSKGKNKYFDYMNFNVLLNRDKEKITMIISEVKVNNPKATFEQISQALNAEFHKESFSPLNDSQAKSETFRQAKIDFLKYQEIHNSQSAIQKYKNFFKILTELEEEENIKINLESFTLDLDDKLTGFLIRKKKYSDNTIFKFYGFLKAFMNWAYSRELTANQKFNLYKKKGVEKEVIFLTKAELQIFMEYNYTEGYLERVRDVFCFACLTGQRYSDIASIRRESISGNVWNVFTQKTRDYLQVPLNREALAILEKYQENEKPLPVISNQKMNVYLKEALKIAGIDQPVKVVRIAGNQRSEEFKKKYEVIGTHTARRTFITLSIEAGIPPEAIMKITGHSDYAMMKKYLKITDNFVQKEFKKYATYLNDTQTAEENILPLTNHKQ